MILNDLINELTNLAWRVGRILILVVFGVSLICLLIRLLWYYRRSKYRKNPLELTLKKDKIHGIVFGRKGRKFAFSPTNDEGHVFVSGGSGSGKTSALLIPTLRAWKGTHFTIDISGDIERNANSLVDLVFAPYEDNSLPYNIFSPIDKLPEFERTEAIVQLALLIMPELPKSSANAAYFQDGGRAILTAALIWGYSIGYDFVEICDEIISSSYKDLFNKIDASDNMVAINFINQFAGNSEQNNAGCKQNTDRAIALFATNEHVKKCLRRPRPGETEIHSSSIEYNNVFIKIPDSRLELLSPLLKILTVQLLNYLADRPENNKMPVLLALDEFASLGKIDITPALRKLRKKHVRIMVLTQSMADIDEIYGRESRMSMLNNFAYKAVLSAADTDTQRYYADLIGMEETKKTSFTSSGSLFHPSTSETHTTERSYVIEPSAFANLGNNLVLLYPGGAIMLKKNFYYK